MSAEEKGFEQQNEGRTAAEAGWQLSRYLVPAKIPETKLFAIYNTYRHSCGTFTPLELYIAKILDEVGEQHPLVERLARRGIVVNFDELKEAVLARAEEAGTNLKFYAASLIDVSPADELDSPMADYAFHGIEVALRPESRHVIVGRDHACVGQNL